MPVIETGQQAAKVLSSVSYFAGLNESALQAVCRAAVKREYAPGQLVILEGEPNTGLYIIEEGWLKVVKIAVDGREQVLQFLGRGEVFNAVAVFTETTNPATVAALEKSSIYIVRRETMRRLVDSQPELANLVIQDLARRTLHLISLVEDLSLRSVEARTARLLLEQAEGEVVARRRWATQAEIASRVGTVPDVINRVLRKLSDEGLIRVARNEIQLVDRPGLEAKALIEP